MGGSRAPGEGYCEPMSRYRWALVALAGFAVLTIAVTQVVRATPPPTASGPGGSALIPGEQRSSAPDFTGLDGWINSAPLTVKGLRNKVVLVDFWTFSCVNCVRTLPHIRHLAQTYGGRGLVVVGVHSPEFDFEKVASNVNAAVKRLGVTWPVALDSQMSTWNAYNNQYWPAEYLVDQQGRIAYFHAGEGDDDITESAVTTLLGLNTAAPTPLPATPDANGQTPELYAGSERGRLADGESYGAKNQPTSYPDRGPPHDSDLIQVSGSWADAGQYLLATSPGRVRLRFSARDVYLVAGPDAGALRATVTLDGSAVGAPQRGGDLGDGGVDIISQQLYHVLTGLDGGRHLIDIAVPAGFRLYTFTFG